MAKSKMVNWHGSPAVEVDGRILPPMAFTAHAHTRDREYLRKLGRAGIEIFFLICDPDWLYEGAFDQLMEDARVLCEEVPEAKIFLRLGVHPSVEWIRDHPDEMMRYQDGTVIPARVGTESYTGHYPGMYALYSDAWCEEASKHILGFLEDVKKTSLADHFIGVFLAGGNTSEWYPSTPLTIRKGAPLGYSWLGVTDTADRDLYADFSPAFRQAFSRYLYARYGSEEELRKAWRDPDADIDDPHIPDMSERAFIDADGIVTHYPSSGAWRTVTSDNHVGSFLNTDKYQCTADFFRAFHMGAADSIIHFARDIKAYDPDLLVGAFYGYFGCLDYFNMCMCTGARKMLDSGFVDMTACPNVYMERQPGGYSAQRVMQDSFRLRGRMFFSEDDTRTYREGGGARDYMEMYSVEDSVAVMKRDFGRDICEDIFGWWFDQYAGGRYKDEAMYRLIMRQQEIARVWYAGDRTKHNEAAFFYDEESVHCVSGGTLFQMIESNRCLEIPRMGIPADFYYHDDIARDDLPEYKLYVFVNCFSLTGEEREAIKRKIRRAGKTALFIYGQGFIDPDAEKRLSAEHISDLTGMKIREIDEPSYTKFKIDPDGPLGADCDPGLVYGQADRQIKDGCGLYVDNQITVAWPLFVCEDEEAETAAALCAEKLPALSVKRENGYTTVFSAAKWLSADIYRAIGRMAGCHVFEDEGDFVFANERFLTIHARTTGRKTIRFKKPSDPWEVYEKKSYGEGVKEITVKMIRGETLMFSLEGAI
ncbi:MAG: hypothetical protein E7576_03915 [Ruminococcaceae bacterium]|nr:hypothetical protein [Oscillospiraceae bacterium]